LLRGGRGTELLFLHTTRYRLDRPLLLRFEESHSHATQHLLYEPAGSEARLLHRAATLVLVDDEISTGRTLVNLAVAFRRVNPHLKAVHILSITNWLSWAQRAEMIAEIGLPTHFHSLLYGRFTFEPNAAFDPGPVPDVTGGGLLKDHCLPP